MSEPLKIAFVGAGSVRYTIKLIGDLAHTEDLKDVELSLMDIDPERLSATHLLVEKYITELGREFKVQSTTNLEKALKGADFVINLALARAESHEDGYVQYEIVRDIGERHGYYRGIDSQEFNMVSDYYTLTNYNQLRMSLEIAKMVEKICPDAWFLQTANPVFEITQMIKDLTRVKVVGLCHGYAHVYEVAKTIGLNPERLTWQVAGVNHAIWLNRFEFEGMNAYRFLDKWIESNSHKWEPKDPWNVDLSPAAIDMYRLYGMLPIGDTVRCGTWKYHYNLEIKRRWYGKFGGIDNEIERPRFYEQLRKTRKMLLGLANKLQQNRSLMLTQIMPDIFTKDPESKEQHIPFINAMVNDKKTRLVLNIENKGAISDIPDDVIVEVPVTVDKDGIHPEKIEPELTERVKQMYLMPRILRMRWALEAFKTGDIDVLKEILIRDPRTRSYEQVESVLKDILDLPFNREMRNHYLKY
ncbi:MAG TPA: alpha-glucosidase AglA [Pseudothermotoga sp.]|nr:alpha-glucosidase AglA [Pseudothermotoga sp.]HOK84567.1 alpha-glucosidase AglA [Pseudothermotoga sp.]HPP69425.1 alpha-glucosidase AglA [Pseudothermotoga sp.]